MVLEKEWKNEHEEMFYQEEEERGESNWHHKDLNIIFILRFFLFFENIHSLLQKLFTFTKNFKTYVYKKNNKKNKCFCKIYE